MATFTYRCQQESADSLFQFDLQFPIGTAPQQSVCPRCGGDAKRVFSPPLLSRAHIGARTLLDREERSRSEPDVVAAPPRPTATRPIVQALNPAWSRLPRP